MQLYGGIVHMADAPQWILADFDALNREHFGGKLRPIKIVVQKPPFGTAAATTPGSVVLEDGKRIKVNAVMFIHPRVAAQDRRWVRDTILHEMVHVALDQEEDDGDKEHGQRFVVRANAIGQSLGLPPVEPGSDEAVDWPQSLRGVGFPAWK
jgi:hypothetical protein